MKSKSSNMIATTTDTFNRPLNDLRISVTDRCNFRCKYCMPKEIYGRDFEYLNRSELLGFDEIERLAVLFKELGVRKIRITGGEPLLRKQIEVLIEKIARLGFDDITLTTNGALLKRKAQSLKDAGLTRVTVSLDSLDDSVFKMMNDVDFPVSKVLEGIEEANTVGLDPVKINMVVKKNLNDETVLDMCRYFKGSKNILRFIEFMDVGSTNGWTLEHVVPTEKLISTINSKFPIVPIKANYGGEVAERWEYVDGEGEIGFISSVTRAFCESCSRARLSADGKIYTCLFATGGFDIKGELRKGASDREILSLLVDLWGSRKDRYSEIRTLNTPSKKKVEMSYIGG